GLDGGLLAYGLTSGTPELHHYDGTWQPIPLDSFGLLTTLWASSPADIYVLERVIADPSYRYVVHHYDGNDWSEVFPGQDFSGRDIWGLAADDLYIVGRAPSESVAVSYRFNGLTWHRVSQNNLLSFDRVRGTASETYAGDQFGLVRSERQAWADPNSLPEPAAGRRLWGDSAGRLVTASDNVVLRFDGTSWETLAFPSAEIADLAVLDFDRILVGDFFNGDVFYYEEGAGWTPLLATGGAGSGTLVSVFAFEADDVYASFRPFFGFGSHKVQHYDGATWTTILSTTEVTFPRLWGIDGNLIAFDASSSQHWNGSEWVGHDFPTGLSIKAMWGASPDDIYAVGAAGSITHFDGTGWTAVSSNTTADLQAIVGTSADNIFAAGLGVPRTLLHFDGSHWSPIRPRANRSFKLLGIAGGDLAAVTTADILERFRSP
ncbi:MAG: hypothetical protein KJO07_17780, partial [Deltaproteobacteria bacterium]|nr:hypothetical protein [Deltaproteobacteria bacterium]